MKLLFFISLSISLFISTLAFSQKGQPLPVDKTIVEAVKQDVWIPFMESYRDLDFKKLTSIHTKDILRVSPKMNQIQSGEAYLQTLNSFFQQIEGLKYQMNIRFAIVSSATSEDKVYQEGYYSIGLKANPEKPYQSTGFSSFSIVAEKEANGKWKISFDSDQPTQLTEEEFQKSGIVYQLDE